MNLIVAWQAAKAWLTAPLFPVKTATEEPTVDDTVQSGTVADNTSAALAVTVTADNVVTGTATAAADIIQPEAYISSADLEAKAKAIFVFLTGEGHKAEDLFIDARAEILALAAKLV